MIKGPIALDENGNKVRIQDAPTHKRYICICCHQPMKARKGESNTPHFAHNDENPSCRYESYLHLTLKDLIYERIVRRDGIAVIHNGKRIEISNYSSCVKEEYVGSLKPDIYVVIDGVGYFLEICVTSSCSKEKIDSGERIIEIRTTEDESLTELKTGDIKQGADYYTLEFYNFPLEPRVRKTAIARSFPLDEPFSVHDNAEEDFFLKRTEPEAARRLNENKTPVVNTAPKASPTRERTTVTVVTSEAKPTASVQWNPKEQSLPICHYILNSDGSDKIVRVDINRVMLRAEPEAVLELGISIPDEKFSYEVGRRYAADKGLLSRELLTDIERSFDMVRVKEYLGFMEIVNS